MKFRLSILPKPEKTSIPSPVKYKSDAVAVGGRKVANLVLKSPCQSNRFSDAGSKDETFFDSQPWLESDCEDDFFSVNGDFTPSRGSTPVHHGFSAGKKMQVNKAPSVVGNPSPPYKRNRLSELFKESLYDSNDEAAANSKNEAHAKVAPEPTYPVHQSKSTNATPVNSGHSGGRAPKDQQRASNKLMKAAQSCFPRFPSSCSFRERKTRMSPPRNAR